MCLRLASSCSRCFTAIGPLREKHRWRSLTESVWVKSSSIAPTHRYQSDLRSICEVCLQPRIADRYGSPQQLADDLGRVLNDEPMEARSPSLPQRLSYWLTDPERLRQAGATMVSIQLAGTAGVFLLIALLFLGFAGPFTANSVGSLVFNTFHSFSFSIFRRCTWGFNRSGNVRGRSSRALLSQRLTS